MNLIHSKDLYYVIKDVLKLLDPKVMNHGTRTAYILYKMLQCTDRYEQYEVAELAMLATFHDIGAYKTDYMQDQLRYESRDYMPHSIYGYLFFLYLTPFRDRAKIILYHHTDYTQVPKSDYEFTDIIYYLNVAEKMDMYSNILGTKFDYMMFQKQAGTKYSAKALDLVYMAEKKYGIFAKLASGEYMEELDKLWGYLIFTDEEKDELLNALMHCASFRSEYTMYDTVTCSQVCEQIGEKMLLNKNEMELLRYAALLHDSGMLGISRDIIEAPRKLTDEEMANLRTHVNLIEEVLKDKIPNEVMDIILTHHERCDGSGYPRRLKEHQMNRLQQILQVADTVTGLTAPRSFREPRSKDQVIAILKEEADKGKFNKEVVRAFVSFYDRIMEGVEQKSKQMLSTYNKLEDNYEITYKQINKQNSQEVKV